MKSLVENTPVSDLKPSPFHAQAERRDHYDQVQLQELADNIRQVGIVQPIVARKVNGHFEIVAGERRWLAAQKAGLEEVPVWIRELNDQQALEIQLVENLQREGLHELAEAEGYETLMQKHGYDIDQLVAKVGRSRSYVYARLKLLALSKEARKAFYAGQINSSHALHIARIPIEALQKQAMKEIIEGQGYGERRESMSSRAAARHIQERYMLRLDQAGFKTSDPDLLPPAGPCTTCPKRTGNQPELFGDIKSPDVCTDPNCFASKREAHTVNRIAAAKQAGQRVISGKEAKKVAPYGADSRLSSGYVRLDDTHYEDGKSRTWRQIIGKKGPTPTLLQDPVDKNKLVEVLNDATLKEALKVAGVKMKPPSRPNSPTAKSPAQKAAERKAKLEAAIERRLIQAIVGDYRPKLDDVALELLAASVYTRAWSDTKKRIHELTDIKPDPTKVDGKKHWDRKNAQEDAVLDYIANANTQGLSNFLILCVLAQNYVGSGYEEQEEDSTPLNRLVEHYGIDAAKIRSEVTAEFEQNHPAPAPKATKKKKIALKAKARS